MENVIPHPKNKIGENSVDMLRENWKSHCEVITSLKEPQNLIISRRCQDENGKQM